MFFGVVLQSFDLCLPFILSFWVCFVFFTKMIKESSEVSNQYLHIFFQQKLPFSRKQKHQKDEARVSFRRERSLVLLFLSFWSEASYLLIYDNGDVRSRGLASETPQTLFAWRLRCLCRCSVQSAAPTAAHPPTHPLHITSDSFSFFISNSLKGKKELYFMQAHIWLLFLIVQIY